MGVALKVKLRGVPAKWEMEGAWGHSDGPFIPSCQFQL